MSLDVFRELSHFVTTVLGTAAALVAFVILRTLLRKIGSQVPVEWCELLDRVLGSSRSHAARQPVNVEYRDATDRTMDLGPFVKAGLRNSRGGRFELCEGAFLNCDPTVIKVGTRVEVLLENGLVRESLRVQVDVQRQTLFVRSGLTLAQLIERINGGAAESAMPAIDRKHHRQDDRTSTDVASAN